SGWRCSSASSTPRCSTISTRTRCEPCASTCAFPCRPRCCCRSCSTRACGTGPGCTCRSRSCSVSSGPARSSPACSSCPTTDIVPRRGSAVPDAPETPLWEPDAGPATPPPVGRILEALLFVGGAPLTAERAAAAVRGLTPAQFTQALDALNDDYRRQGRPYLTQLQEH